DERQTLRDLNELLAENEHPTFDARCALHSSSSCTGCERRSAGKQSGDVTALLSGRCAHSQYRRSAEDRQLKCLKISNFKTRQETPSRKQTQGEYLIGEQVTRWFVETGTPEILTRSSVIFFISERTRLIMCAVAPSSSVQGVSAGHPLLCRVSLLVLLTARHTIRKMESSGELRLGKKLNEGKTKEVYELLDLPGCVLMQSKDQITAGNAARKDHMEGKAAISNKTTCCIFKLLQEAGIKTAFVKKCSATGFIATHCEMIPIEWVCRRIATGSFLKRNPGVPEGCKFYPPKVEMFFKDDANNDPQWSEEQLIAANLNCAGLVIGQAEVDIMNHSTAAIFEIVEKTWSTQDCTLVDMKIEFGVDVTKKEIVLADVIDNDSWRLWPSGDKTQQKDKQTYRDLKEITPEAMQMVRRNFEWVADKVEENLKCLLKPCQTCNCKVHCEKIKKSCANYGIPCELRVTSAHKGPDETLRVKAEYEGDCIPTVFVAVAGRSNGLDPVLSGNTAYPVINCPPLTADWGAQDVWSSLRMPSGLGCSTVLSPEAAAQFAAQILGLNDHLVWSKLRSCTLNTWISLKEADTKLRQCSK
ncbi:unnamed protein product, partial [Ranitomeya imitator]